MARGGGDGGKKQDVRTRRGCTGGISRSPLVGGEGWEEAVPVPSCTASFTKEHFILVKRLLALGKMGVELGGVVGHCAHGGGQEGPT